MPAIQKGWKDEDRDVHFFWGLAGKNTSEIRGCLERGDEWWFVDTGYLSSQITRYPEPMINDYDKTYFRIIKGGIHTNKFSATTPDRRNKLIKQGIDAEFKGWKDNGEHILLCPSSPMVCYYINNLTQEDWLKQVGEEIRKHTDRPIKMRNKPRPSNEFWGTDIKDDLKNAWCVVTNMSLAAIDGVLNMTPAFTHQKHVASLITGQHELVERPYKPEREKVEEWLNMVANHQFTIQEIEDGLAFDILKAQYQSVG
jgi:hypothetical protein